MDFHASFPCFQPTTSNQPANWNSHHAFLSLSHPSMSPRRVNAAVFLSDPDVNGVRGELIWESGIVLSNQTD